MRLEGGGGGHDISGVFDCFLAQDPGEGTSRLVYEITGEDIIDSL
jgi:hypothetical protein